MKILCLLACISGSLFGTADASDAGPAVMPGGALDVDCSHVGHALGSPGYQFITTCAERSLSPDGHWAVIQRRGEVSRIFLKNLRRAIAERIHVLEDGMPFVIFWSPRSDWFFANHYLGSGEDELLAFQIVAGKAVERPAVYRAAARAAVKRFPCLRPAQVVASGWHWSRDGRHIAMAVYSRPDACIVEGSSGHFHQRGNWKVLWMIGDVKTGKILPNSIRVRNNGTAPFPTTGPYAEFHD